MVGEPALLALTPNHAKLSRSSRETCSPSFATHGVSNMVAATWLQFPLSVCVGVQGRTGLSRTGLYQHSRNHVLKVLLVLFAERLVRILIGMHVVVMVMPVVIVATLMVCHGCK